MTEYIVVANARKFDTYKISPISQSDSSLIWQHHIHKTVNCYGVSIGD